MSFTNHLETLILQWAFTTGSATRPTAWHVGLFTAAPGEAGGGTEVSGGSYARQSATFTVSGNLATNSAAIEWPAATASWGTISHAAVFDASTGGNMLGYATLQSGGSPATFTIGSGSVFRIPSSDLDITLD
jgi:hypothetical protein